MDLYPLRFVPVLKEKVWGGRGFQDLFGRVLPPGKDYGESWEVSAHPNGSSLVSNGPLRGTDLPSLCKDMGAELLGARIIDRFKGKFPLLIKYLDIHDKLSVQVHPDDAWALAHEGEFGKSECWYVMEASDDARLILGTAPGISAGQFRDQALKGEWGGLFNEVPVRRGDFVHIVPGTIHATLQGSIVIAEVQQNSDTTYRLYDFDRLENGAKRPLHLEKALAVSTFGTAPHMSRKGERPVEVRGSTEVEVLVRDPHYAVDLVRIGKAMELPVMEVFQVVSVLGGSGSIRSGRQVETIGAGETWFVPQGLQVDLEGTLEIMRSWVP